MNSDKTTITDNEVIARFMGLMVFQTWAEMEAFPIDKLQPWTLPEQCTYDSKWSDLMPVWYKFRDLDTSTFDLLDHTRYKRYWYELANDIPRKPIADVCKLLAEGIRWYNSTTQNKEQS